MRVALRGWLRAPGSLSRRLAACGEFTVQTLHQGPGPLLAHEVRDLKCRAQRHWIREVVLRVDEEPVVWARSVTPCRALRGPWRALRSLGRRPLAQLLFDDASVARSALRSECHGRGGPCHRRADAAWRAAGERGWPGGLLVGRSSLFSRKGAPLRLFEAFAPGVVERLGVCRRRLPS